MAFQRMTEQLKVSIDDLFTDLSKYICEDLMCCDMNVQYVDGTKIEAKANKNTFVYKKCIRFIVYGIHMRISDGNNGS